MAHFSPTRHTVSFVPLANILRPLIALISVLLFAIASLAQNQDQTTPTQDPKAGQSTAGPTSIGQPTTAQPAGQSASAPAANVIIPAGTFVQGKVERLTRNGSRAEMALQSVSVMFPDGYG